MTEKTKVLDAVSAALASEAKVDLLNHMIAEALLVGTFSL